MGGARLAPGTRGAAGGAPRLERARGPAGPGARGAAAGPAAERPDGWDGSDYNSILIAWGLCCLKLPLGFDGSTFSSSGYFLVKKKKKKKAGGEGLAGTQCSWVRGSPCPEGGGGSGAAFAFVRACYFRKLSFAPPLARSVGAGGQQARLRTSTSKPQPNLAGSF